MIIFLVLTFVYIAFLILLGIKIGKKESSEDFLIAGRSQSWWRIAASKYAASIGAGWFLTYTGFAYEYGWPLSLVVLGGIFGVLLYAFWAVPKIRAVGHAYTQGDYVLAKTGSKIAQSYVDGTVGIIAVLSLLIAVTGASTLLDSFNVMSYEVASLLTMSTVVVYIMFAGYRAVMVTDIFQGLLIIVLTVVVAAFVFIGSPPSYGTLIETRDISTLGTIMLMFFGFVSVFADPTRYQVSFAGVSDKAVRKGMLATAIPILITAAAIFLLASSVYEVNTGLEAAAVFLVALTEFLPTFLVPVGFFMFLVALMSTSDSYLYALASHSVTLFTKQKYNARLIKIFILVYGVILCGLSLLYRDVVGVAVLTAGVLFVLALPMFYLLNGGSSSMRFILMISGGFVGFFAGVLTFGLVPDAAIFVIVGFIIGAFIPVRFF